MLDSLKRWLAAPPEGAPAWPDLAAWAQQRQFALRPVRESSGFIIDGQSAGTPWRLEWGPSQRPYIDGNELRVRAELSVPRELQALVISRELMEKMERAVFERYVEGVQTRIDTETPSEMRWLVMFPKLNGGELGALRERYGALSSFRPWLQQWLAGGLTAALADAPQAAERALVLIVGRRRLSLRTALAQPDGPALERWLQLYDCALREARRVSVDFSDPGAPSTQPSLFPSSAPLAEAARR